MRIYYSKIYLFPITKKRCCIFHFIDDLTALLRISISDLKKKKKTDFRFLKSIIITIGIFILKALHIQNTVDLWRAEKTITFSITIENKSLNTIAQEKSNN